MAAPPSPAAATSRQLRLNPDLAVEYIRRATGRASPITFKTNERPVVYCRGYGVARLSFCSAARPQCTRPRRRMSRHVITAAPCCRLIEFQYQSGPLVVPEAVTAAVRCAPRGNRLRLHSAAFGPPVVGAGATLHFYGCDVEAYSSLADAMRPTADALELFGDENGAQLAMTGGTLLFGCTVRLPAPVYSHTPHHLGCTVRRRRRCRRRPLSSPRRHCAGGCVSCLRALHCRPCMGVAMQTAGRRSVSPAASSERWLCPSCDDTPTRRDYTSPGFVI